MPFGCIFRDPKGKNGIDDELKQAIEQQYRLNSDLTHEGSSSSFYTLQEQSPWASLPPELLLDIVSRVEASETMWPNRRAVVVCAAVCKSWREAVQEVVRTPEECGLLTFPMSLKQVIEVFLILSFVSLFLILENMF